MFKSIIALVLFVFLQQLAVAEVTLTQVNGFGSNPGDLKMYYYAPKVVDPKAPVVVLLHGCTQSASEFDDETGWTKYADENGFYLLLPQQKEVNNQSRCFTWFEPSDIQRDKGEAASIAQMVEHMDKLFNVDTKRVYIAGLSAGAAMANVMLATYPEMFVAGAIVAGVQYGCATNSINAWQCMSGFQFPAPTVQQRGDLVRRAGGNFRGPWPRVMIIHGTTDELVNYKNAQFLVDQWTNVHETDNQADSVRALGAHQYAEFKKGAKTMVSLITVKNMRHGYPVDSKNKCGEAGKYVIDVGFCASEHIANFFKVQK